ncbi:MAG: hypothetical protein ACREIA_05100 [Opitutaceae bacterium]
MPIAVPKAEKRGRLSKFSRALFDRVVQSIRDGAPTADAIEREGIDHSTFHRHLQRQPELVPAMQAAQLERDRVRNVSRIEEAEMDLKRRGIDGWTEPIFDAKGNLCGERRRFSDACLIFFLKNHKPEIYADKPTTVVATQVNITPAREKEIMREWRRKLGATDTP